MPYTTIQIQEDQQNQATPFANNQMCGPFLNGSDIYVSTFRLGGGFIKINKSTNGGLSWSEFDGPTAKNATAVQVGTDLIVAYTTTLPDTNVYVAVFDMTSDTWGSPDSTALVLDFVMGIVDRGAAGQLILYVDSTNGLYGAIDYDGGFGSSFSLITNFPTVGEPLSSMGSCADSDGRTHVFMGWEETIGLVPHAYYQAVEPDNSLGQFDDLSSIVFDPRALGQPLALTDLVVWPVADPSTGPSFSFVTVGSPQSAPSWSSLAPIDPDNVLTGYAGKAALIGGTLAVAFISDDSSFTSSNAVRVAITTDLADPTSGWTCTYFLDGVAAPILEGNLFNTIPGSDGANIVALLDAITQDVGTGCYFITFTAGGTLRNTFE